MELATRTMIVLLLVCLVLAGCLGSANTPYVISGRVVDQYGNGIEGVTISFKGSPGLASTDSQGRWVKHNITGSTEISLFLEQHVFEPEVMRVSRSTVAATFIGYRLPTEAELLEIRWIGESVSEQVVSGKSNQEVGTWAGAQSAVEQVVASDEELQIKYVNGGWECWFPATPPLEGLSSGPLIYLPQALPSGAGRKAIVVNCTSNQPRMDPHAAFLKESKGLLDSAGFKTEYVDVNPRILDTLRSLEDYAVIVVFAHGGGESELLMTTGLDWDDAYKADWCKDLFRKTNVLFVERWGSWWDEYRQEVGITPKFWSTYYSTKQFHNTLFFNCACSAAQYSEPSNILLEQGVATYLGWTGVQYKSARTTSYLLKYMVNGMTVGQAFDLLAGPDTGYDGVELLVKGNPDSTITAGMKNYGLQFNGQNFAEIGHTTVLNSLPLTIECWVCPTLRSDQKGGYNYKNIYPINVVSNDSPGRSGHGFGLNVFTTGSELFVANHAVSDVGRVIPNISFNPDQWYHIAVVYT